MAQTQFLFGKQTKVLQSIKEKKNTDVNPWWYFLSKELHTIMLTSEKMRGLGYVDRFVDMCEEMLIYVD